ncbi:class I SAM-dependent methyltransferase [Arthrospiribacter ruber]|uniref:Class I SAM-dependent methyltransferase n=1 Tax=Arthrospiribacter ruber TaxID=2487934 RepID=A0A951IWB2_9BACT|nr:class I SAM-dependent methyltransferase [Arthrospiribacter ruber]MBW3467527.1 class I SAM-dependent methyltransferase [Arthrospiribacter ruber]
MRQTECPLCHTPPSLATEDGSLVKCAACQLNWTFLPTEFDPEALYQDEVYAVVDNRNSVFEKIIFREAKKVIQTVRKHSKSNAIKCLDFGSGKGQFLLQAKHAGWKGVGVETSIPRAEFARNMYGLNIHQSYYEGGKIEGGEYDFISLFHVLEHLPEPIPLLDKLCKENLKKDGLLLIEVPNLASWQAKMAGKDWMHLDIPKHLSHWDEDLLVSEVEKLGFRKITSQYFSIHLGVLGMLRSLLGKIGYRGNIIFDLKNRRSQALLFKIALLMPLAFLLEMLSTLLGKGGVMRIYFKKNG